MEQENIVHVTESDFEYEVIAYSQNTPVLVDFWATWCVPCKVLGPVLEKLAEEGRGAFRLAKVDVDQNQNLAIRYGIRSIPMVKAFDHGQVIAELTGAQPEARVREFIRKLVPSPSDLLIEKAKSLYQAHQWTSAEQTFRQALEQTPDEPVGLLGLAKSILGQGQGEEAAKILRSFPASKEFSAAQTLLPLAEANILLKRNALTDDDTFGPAYANALRLAARGNIPSALDGLLDILRQDKQYLRGQVRLVVLGLLELLGENDPQTRQYRSELSTILFR